MAKNCNDCMNLKVKMPVKMTGRQLAEDEDFTLGEDAQDKTIRCVAGHYDREFSSFNELHLSKYPTYKAMFCPDYEVDEPIEETENDTR